jgi:hypothetical protein
MSLKGIECHFNGASSELFVAYKATERGFVVSYPLFTQSKYDLIIDTGKKLLKVQVKKAVKSSAKGNEFIQIRLGGCGHPDYKAGDYDYVAMVFHDKVWMLPYKDTEGHKSMSFSIFSESSKSSKYLSEHTFEIFAEKINGYE